MYDVIIIGCGVAGMSAAVYLKRSNLNVLIIESDSPGGQINKTNKIENYMGFTTIDGPTLAFNMFNQISNLKIPYITDTIINIENQRNKKIVIGKNKKYECKKVVLATGRSVRKLGIPNEDKYIGKGISYCAICDGSLYKNKNVVVIGGGNSAFEEGSYLADIAKSVILMNRSEKLRAEQTLVDKFNSFSNTKILYNRVPKEFVGKENLQEIVVLNKDTNLEENHQIDGAFIYVGFGPNNGFLDNLNVTNEQGYIIVNKNMETKVKGIYACGDAIKKEVYQIITASSEGAIAAISIKKSIR